MTAMQAYQGPTVTGVAITITQNNHDQFERVELNLAGQILVHNRSIGQLAWRGAGRGAGQ